METDLNQGDSTDLIGQVAGVVLSSTSRPHTREWEGRDSGPIISNVSIDDNKISFIVGQTANSEIFKGETSPNLTIPDNKFRGVESIINVNTSGIVRRIKVDVNISRTFILDLVIELRTPTGRRAILHSRQGGAKDYPIILFDSERLCQLSNIVGQRCKALGIAFG